MSSNPSWSIPITPLGSVVAATRTWALDGRLGASILVKASFAAGADGGAMTIAGPDPIVAADAQDPPRVVRSRGDGRVEEQRVEALRGDEAIDFDGPAPGAPRIRCHLPRVRASALLQGFGPGAPRQIDLRPELLRIDEVRRRCSLTFRGSITVPADARPADLRVVAALGLHGAPAMLPGLDDDDEDEDGLDDPTARRPEAPEPRPSSPHVAPPPPPTRAAAATDATVIVQPAEVARVTARAALPFVEAPPGGGVSVQASAAPPLRPAAGAEAEGATLALDPASADRVATGDPLPFGHASTPATVQTPASAPPPAPIAPAPAPAARSVPTPTTPAGTNDPPPEKRSTSWATVAEEQPADVSHRAEAARRLPQKPNLKGDLYGDFIRRGKR